MTPPHTFAYPPPDQHLTLEETELLAELDEYGPNSTVCQPRRPLSVLLAFVIDKKTGWDPVRLMIERQLDIDIRRSGLSSLWCAYSDKRVDVAEALLDAGIDMYATQYYGGYSEGDVMLGLALSSTYYDDAATQLIKYGYDVRLSHFTTHIIRALFLPIDEYKELFEKIHMGHQLWMGTFRMRASIMARSYGINTYDHWLFLRQHEFMSQLVVMQRRVPLDMWHLIGEMSFGQTGGMRA